MKTKLILSFLAIIASLSCVAQNRWNVYAGGSISHDCGGYFDYNADGNTNFKWGGGAILGAGYEIDLSGNWSFTPALELSYTDNGAYYNKTGKPAVDAAAVGTAAQSTPHIWTGSWAVGIPLTAGYRIPVAENVSLKIDAGAYLSEAFAVRHFVNSGTAAAPVFNKRKVSNDFGNDFQIGVIGGVSVETGNHFSYFFRTQYPFLKDRWSTSTITLALGVKYAF